MKLSGNNISAVIAAAGTGSRAQLGKNKLLSVSNGQSIIEKTVIKFVSLGFSQIIVSVNNNDLQEMQALLSALSDKIEFVPGGQTRFSSVENALAKVTCPIVLIHDGARPFVSTRIIKECIQTVKEYGSAVPALPAADTFAAADGGLFLTGRIPRDNLYSLQTPQGFYTIDIKKAYELAAAKHTGEYTDDSSVFGEFIRPPKLFLGHLSNKKLTYKEDFENNMNFYTGIGFDTHRLVKGRKLILGGVHIENDSGLLGHSDADALTHSVMDALLSAAGLRDIGCFFPDTDAKYKDASSIYLLREVVRMLFDKNFSINNVSAVIAAQKPKLSPYIDKMKQNLAEVMHISTNRVGITATTAEQMGFVGRGEGIAVTASCLIYNENN